MLDWLPEPEAEPTPPDDPPRRRPLVRFRRLRTEPVPAVPPMLTLFTLPFILIGLPLLGMLVVIHPPESPEGQFELRLPPDPDAIPGVPPFWIDLPAEYAARVTATEGGAIREITLRHDGPSEEREWPGERNLGNAPKQLQVVLRALAAIYTLKCFVARVRDQELPFPPSPPKLTLEIDGRLLHAYVVQLLDVATLAGFEKVFLVPIDKSKR